MEVLLATYLSVVQYVSIIFCLVTAMAASSSSVFIFGSSIRFM